MSTYSNKIDTKGRVSMPANFRDIITKENNTCVVIYKSLSKNCLVGCTIAQIEKIQEAIDKFDPFSEEKDAFETALFAESVSLEIDKDGRINIPKQYTQFAKIDGTALFVGKGKKFEIWNPTAYDEDYKKCREYAVKNKTMIKW